MKRAVWHRKDSLFYKNRPRRPARRVSQPESRRPQRCSTASAVAVRRVRSWMENDDGSGVKHWPQGPTVYPKKKLRI